MTQDILITEFEKNLQGICRSAKVNFSLRDYGYSVRVQATEAVALADIQKASFGLFNIDSNIAFAAGAGVLFIHFIVSL